MAHIDDTDTARANKNYISKTMEQPLLEADEEQQLAIAWRDDGDEKALHQMVTAYARLVVSMATKFRNYGLPHADLIQEGNVGLMKAAERFDPEREVRFSTYAAWWIKAEMQDFVLRNWSIVRTGTTAAQKSLFFNLRRLRAQIMAETENEYLDHEGRESIAKKLDVKLGDVENMERRLAAGDQSLNAPLAHEGESQWQDLLSDDDQMSPEDIAIDHKDAEIRSAWLSEALETLDHREQHIIKERRLTDEVVTLEELGQELGVSKERVRQLEVRAMDKLKASLLEHVKKASDLIPGF